MTLPGAAKARSGVSDGLIGGNSLNEFRSSDRSRPEPASTGWMRRAEDGRRPSYNENAGIGANRQNKHCGLIIDRGKKPFDLRAKTPPFDDENEKTATTRPEVCITGSSIAASVRAPVRGQVRFSRAPNAAEQNRQHQT